MKQKEMNCKMGMMKRVAAAFAVIWGIGVSQAAPLEAARGEPPPKLMGNRFLTLNTVVRVNQIEAARNLNLGMDEAEAHTPEYTIAFREAVERGAPGARITWAFTWLALHDQRPNYKAIRDLVVSYHKKYGDEITFMPGAYFAPMYNTREQVNRDLHDALALISAMVGGGYRPKSVVAGFLAAENQRYLSEQEGIHVCQGTIWSQYGIDNGDGDGSLSYPYYPSREHYCKPAQGQADFIDCVCFDGWTCDFLAARRPGFKDGFNSRMGVGPIETIRNLGTVKGIEQMMATTGSHFDTGFKHNGFAWVVNCWEISLVKSIGKLDCLTLWLAETRRRWPETQFVTSGEFGETWRREFTDNDKVNYRFVEKGTGIGGSDANLEIRWFMNKEFRLALLRDWKTNGPVSVIDFTRYDLKAQEPADPKPGEEARNWSLMNRINQKGTRPEDTPVPLTALSAEEQALIKRRYPELFTEGGRK